MIGDHFEEVVHRRMDGGQVETPPEALAESPVVSLMSAEKKRRLGRLKRPRYPKGEYARKLIGEWSIGGHVMVVPPLECAWLTGEGHRLGEAHGSFIVFEAKGNNDATVILKQEYGSRRWQDINWAGVPDANYTIIIGSHRNNCLKIEKNGELQCTRNTESGHMKLSSHRFSQFWVYYGAGCIAIGWGFPSEESCCFTWEDPSPIDHIQYVGLSSWDSHVGYRGVRIIPEGGSHSHQRCASEVSDVDQVTWGSLNDLCNAFFRDSDKGRCRTPEIDESSFTSDRSYEGKVEGYGMSSLKEICLSVMQNNHYVHPGNVFQVLSVADCVLPEASELRQRAVDVAAQHLLEAVKIQKTQLAKISSQCMKDIVMNQSISCTEKALYDVVMMWAGSDDAFPSAFVEGESNFSAHEGPDDILWHIRFPLMSQEDLFDVMNTTLYKRSIVLRRLVQEAIELHAMPGTIWKAPSIRVNGIISEALCRRDMVVRCQRRCPIGCTPLVHMYDGDTNGICHYIGTRYGRDPSWVNPVAAGLISIKSSSPLSRFCTDAKSLVSRNFSKVNFAGPRRTANGAVESWWMVDLGEHHRLQCTRYTLRHDGSEDYLRYWLLQGSNDTEDWVTLSHHFNDQTLSRHGQFASWPIDPRLGNKAFRYFRIFQDHPNSSMPNPWHISLSYVDFYGDFF